MMSLEVHPFETESVVAGGCGALVCCKLPERPSVDWVSGRDRAADRLDC